MKKLFETLERGAMLALSVMPVCVLVFRALLKDYSTGVICLLAQTLIATLAGMLPAYVGNYTETEVIRYEGGRGSDPNPDREAVRETIKEGRRFPVRLPAAVILLICGAMVSFMLPGRLFADTDTMKVVAFAAIMFALNAAALYGSSSYSLFSEIPGIALGFAAYLGTALYIQFSSRDNSDIQLIVSVCSLIYLFMGGVCLNRAVLSSSVSQGREAKGAPRQIVRRNRRIVLGFTALAAVVSFVNPIREAAIWLWGRFSALVKLVGNLLRGGEAAEADPDMLAQMMGGGIQQDAGVIIEESTESGSDLIVYIFFGFVAVSFLWMLYDLMKKLINKLSKLIGMFAVGMSEGYYDERRVLSDEEEARSRLRGGILGSIKKLLEREPAWEKLSARDKVRRLLRDVYQRRGRKIKNLRSKTAREALSEMQLGGSALGKLYDRARYSEHDISADDAETLRKEMRS